MTNDEAMDILSQDLREFGVQFLGKPIVSSTINDMTARYFQHLRSKFSPAVACAIKLRVNPEPYTSEMNMSANVTANIGALMSELEQTYGFGLIENPRPRELPSFTLTDPTQADREMQEVLQSSRRMQASIDLMLANRVANIEFDLFEERAV